VGLFTRGNARGSILRVFKDLCEPKTVVLNGGYLINVAGQSRYQEILERVAGGERAHPAHRQVQAVLKLEPDNPYDPNAVGVYLGGEKVGYLPSPAADAFQPVVTQLAARGAFGACTGTIIGGRTRSDVEGHFGIVLNAVLGDCLPADF
jgi:hypothetical protein